MNIDKIYISLLNNPCTPKVYRDLREYYYSAGMYDEAEGFALLLKEEFNEIADLPNYHPQQLE